jgi:LysR family transcriptional regulator, flagellar master operon regulator
MDLDLLRTFLELNRTRHFGRAADALFITQAAVSSRLKTLEGQLGVRLFDRRRRKMRLTPEGSRLLGHAERMIDAWRVARQDVSLEGASDQLVIGGSLRLWDVLLQRWLHDLRRAYPTLAIIAESQAAPDLTRKLIDGTLDVAIMLEPAQLDIMQVREIATVEFIFVSSKPALTTIQALAQGYVHVDWGLSFALDYRRTFPDAPKAMTRVSHAQMAYEYLSVIGGSAILPRRMVAKEVALGLLHEVIDAPTFTRRAYATYPVRSPRLELIEQSLQLIRSGG